MSTNYFKSIIISFCLILSSSINAQSHILNEEELNIVFSDDVRAELKIVFPIYRAYAYDDEAGDHYLVLTEKPSKVDPEGAEIIHAFCYDKTDSLPVLRWSCRDFYKSAPGSMNPETAIWFWTKYFVIEDFDYDGFVDPILIYGSSASNGTDDGRVNILVYYKGKKHGIRHQNSVSDYFRSTKVDPSFYKLPEFIIQHVTKTMKQIEEDGNAIFPNGWEESMESEAIYLGGC